MRGDLTRGVCSPVIDLFQELLTVGGTEPHQMKRD